MAAVVERGSAADQSSTDLPTVGTPQLAALTWSLSELKLLWPPLTASVLGQWLASALQVTTATLLAWASMRVTASSDTSIALPSAVAELVGLGSNAVGRALMLALGLTLVVGVLDILVAWTLTWGHAKILPGLTRAAVRSVLPRRGERPLDTSICIQRWLLKSEVSRFLVGTLAQACGALGSVVIVLVAAWQATPIGGGVALAGVAVWFVIAIPLSIQVLRATRSAATAHEHLGHDIRTTAELGEALWHASHQRAWVKRLDAATPGLRRAVSLEGAWGSLMYGGLATVGNALPLVASLAVATTGNVGTLIAVYLYLSRLTGPLGNLASALPVVQQQLVSIQRVYDAFQPSSSSMATSRIDTDGLGLQLRDLVIGTAHGRPIIRFPDFKGAGLLAVLGPTGSGKSTLLRMIAGIVVPESGQVLFGGAAPDGSDAWRQKCALMPQEPGLVPANTDADTCGTPTSALARLLEIVRSRKPQCAPGVESWSVGERRALALTRVLAADAPLLLLDEPLAGMDAVLARLAAAAIRDAAFQGRTVVVATHERDLELLEADGVVSLCAPDRAHEGFFL